MKNGIEFKSEEHAERVFEDIVSDSDYSKAFAIKCREKGYIKKSALEEARAIRKETYEPNVELGTAVDLLVRACHKYEQHIKELEGE